MRILWEADEASGATGGGGAEAAPATSAPASTPGVASDNIPVFADVQDEGDPDAPAEKPVEAPVQTQAGDEKKPDEAAKEKAPETEVPVVSFSPQLIARAVRAGLDDVELSEFESAKELERFVARLERRSDKKTENSAAQPGDDVKVDEIPDLDPKEYEESLVKGWSTLKGMVKSLHAELQSVRAETQRRASEEAYEWFDGQITTLGAEGEGLFGKGRGMELKAEGAELANREKLWGAVKFLQDSYVEKGMRPPHKNELFKQAYRLAFGDYIAQHARKQVAQHLDTRKKAFLSPPSQRNGSASVPPEQKAVVSVQEKLNAIRAR